MERRKSFLTARKRASAKGKKTLLTLTDKPHTVQENSNSLGESA